MSTIATYKAKSIRALKDNILVKDMEFSQRLSRGGIILTSDDMKSQGVRPRWAEVCAVGPEQKDVRVGQWILVAHGRWTRGLKIEVDGVEMVVRMIDQNDILLVSDDPMVDETMSNAVIA